MSQARICIISLFFVSVLTIGCTGNFGGIMTRTKVEIVPIEITPYPILSPSGPVHGYIGHFDFHNVGSRPVRMWTHSVPVKDPIMPDDLTIDVYEGAEWQEVQSSVPVFADREEADFEEMIAVVEPDEHCRVYVDMSCLQTEPVPFRARITVNGFVSEAFSIEQEDVSERAMARVREKRTLAIREKMRLCAMRPEITEAEDPLEAFLHTLSNIDIKVYNLPDLSPNIKVGFPWIPTPDGSLDLHFGSIWSGFGEYTGYHYFIQLIIDPKMFSPKWFREEEKEVSVTSERKDSEFDDPFVMANIFLPSESWVPFVVNPFVFELQFSITGKDESVALPTDETMKEIGNLLVRQFETCLKE